MGASPNESGSDRDVRVLAELAAQLQDVADEDRVYELLAEGIRRIAGDESVVNVSALTTSRGPYVSKALVGLGPFAERLLQLLGRRPEELGGDYTDGVKRAMALGRLTRVEGGVAELARDALPPALLRTAGALVGVEDVHVVGFKRGSSAGGVTIITRRPGVSLPAAAIEAMTMLAAVAVEHVRGEKFRQLVANTHDIIYSLTAEGVLTFVSPAWTRLLGHSPDEVEGRPFSGFLHPDDLPTCAAFLRRVLERGERQEGVELRVRHKDGGWRWHTTSANPRRDADGAVAGFDGIARDITERKRAEEELLSTQANMSAILENTLDNIWSINRSYEIVHINEVFARAFHAVFGVTLEPESNLHESLPPAIRPIWKERYDRALRGERFVFVDAIEAFGSLIHIEVAVNPIVKQGEVVGASFFGRDITAREQAEQEKEKLRAQLAHAQKMESVGRLAGGVAHDFNNMLGVILGRVELGMHKLREGDPLRSDLEEIQKSAGRSAKLTKQLLAFARKQTIAPEVLDLNAAIEGMLKLLRRLIGEDVDLVWLPGRDLWPVYLDPSQVDQILANLCVNARDAISGVGKITVETGTATFDEERCALHAGSAPGDYVVLAVSDDGCGMDAGTLAHLFEPFFTTKEVGEGTGLGLATVYGAVRQNDGFINVYSEPGHGTTFRIYLPRHAAPVAQAPGESQGPAPSHGSETILLVEDEPMLLEMVTKMLELLGYTVLAARTPGEAIRLVREHEGGIDLLLTDVIMPEMNGRSLAGHLLSVYPDLRRLFMSGYTANVIAHHGVLDEGVHFLPKPFSIKDLSAKIREALGRE